ncbi:efflux RND transporter permease subunit [Flavisolibacter ginsenosidimutans]|uniref:Efflux RND transporter permease subunit n=1 Tax=Flavisolibacter ginsenosidimutans TaxID=661481 RepID=A0A5B8ULX3_9BACT|nr:efflux RND transporter permease subunit [Flavisolibacter ginsenosidimutans]QEC57169.1 efflux RND transporter permease subunit [Flavisolibacter ginsenosidimutans]
MRNFFITYKNPLSVLIALIIMGGVYVYTKLQTSLFPEITFPKIKVIADAGLQPVNKMMVTVTQPLENAIKQVPDLADVRSTTSRGSCEISAFMNWDANVDLSQQRIESRIAQIRNSLPPDVNITVEKMNPSILPVIGYTLETNSQSRTPVDMKQLALYTVKPFLSQVPGVAEVRIIGGKQKEYWLTLDAQKMSTLGITPDKLSTALSQTNFIQANGYLSDYRQLYLTVTDATVHSLEDLQNLVVSNDGRRIVQLKDIADAKINEGVEYTKINANGRAGILVAIVKQPNANLISLSEAVTKKLEELKRILPSGVSIRPYYVQADFVHDSVRSVTDSLWIGLVLAIVVAIIFLRSLKASATILITIPVTICLTLIAIYAVGYTLNIMTLGAIAAAIGLIIDDAIVVVEQIHRSHEEHPDEPSTVVVQKAIHYLFPAMIGSSLSTIVIFIPFEIMSGVAGEYFKVMTNTMIITLICSFFVTWICLPVIYLLLTREKPDSTKAKKEEKPHEVKKQKWVAFFIHKPYVSFVIVAALAVSIWLVLPLLKTGFLPEMDEGSIVLDYNSPPGTSLEETDRILHHVETIINKVPEVQAYSRRTGTQMGFFITEPNRGDYLIQLKKNRKRSTEDVIADLRKQISSSQPALTIDFGQVINDMLGDLMESVQPIEIKIYGDNVARLQAYSQQVSDIVSKVEGTADMFNGIVISGPSVTILPNYAALAQYGLTPQALQTQVQLGLQGTQVGTILEKQQLSTVRIVYPGTSAQSVEGIKHLQIFTPSGRLMPITSLASVEVNPGDAEIQRENLQAMGVVTGRLENRDLGSTMKEIQRNVSTRVVLPQGYHIEYGGAYAQQQQSFHELLLILITSSLLVFGVILFLFKDFFVAILILLLAVLGISGSYLALFLTNTPLNVGSYTGLIMIVGIIGENAIFTFLQFRDTLQQSGSVDDSVVFAISTRLRPKLMTALGAIIALMPLALGIGTGAELHQPLAISVIGGFLTALPLLLIVLPSMLRIIYRRRKIEANR